MRSCLPALATLAFLTACADDPLALVPAPTGSDVFASETVAPGRALRMLDVCEPSSFNLAVGAGTCVDRKGGLSFAHFIGQLEAHQTVESWRFMPDVINVREGTTLAVLNVGGEVHTFTEVAEFGGGVVPILNQLTGETEVAPECAEAPPEAFVPAGEHTHHTFDGTGEKKFMCCIHPWMRAVARVR